MTLKELAQAIGVSGFEREVGKAIAEEIRPYADEVIIDALGNVIALKKGNGANKKVLAASAHMDEIGFIVTSVTSDGFVKVRNIGGLNVFTSYMNRVRFKNGAVGLMGCGSKIAKVEGNGIDELYVDLGCSTKEEAEKVVNVGDHCCLKGEYEELPGGRVSSKALDDRIGCWVEMECLKKMGTPYNDIYFVFSVQEEVGCRGAKVAANRIRADVGIAIDVTPSFDVPGENNANAVLGKGAAVKVMDSSVICDEYLVEEMVKCAKDNGIVYQIEVLPYGGTDASAFNMSHEGVKACGISIPERYCHSPYGIVDMGDVQACIDLLEKFADVELAF